MSSKKKASKLPLVSFTVRIMPPSDDMSNEAMDDALRTWEATAEHNDNLRHLISERFIEGVIALGEAGFTIEIEK